MKKSELNFNEYIERYVKNLKNLNDKAKARFFLECLKDDWGEDALAIPDIFGVLDKEYLLESLEKYIKRYSSRQVIGDYRRTVISLCEAVCENYGIKNNFLESVSERNSFDNTVKEWIDLLEEPKSRECMSVNDFETLDGAIRDFLNTDNLEEEMYKSIEIENFKPNHYGRLVSAIALTLVHRFGIDNNTISNLKIADLNIEEKILEIKDFKLPISEELDSALKLYLKGRTLVIKNNNLQTDMLFIKKTGIPYLDINGRPDSGQLFLLMGSALRHTNTASLRYKTIIELVSRGANINLLSQLTNVNSSKIVEICIDDKANLENIFRDVHCSYTKRSKPTKKGQMQCPYCGNFKDACSENWILIQVDGEEKKHLACRECRGLDGKYRY